MSERQVSASKFKAECLRLMDDVALTGRSLIVTKRGRHLVRVIPLEDVPSLEGSVRFLVDDDVLLEPLGEPWNADVEQ